MFSVSAAQRMRLDGAAMAVKIDGPYVARTPVPATGPRPYVDLKGMLPTPMPQEAMGRGWIGIVAAQAHDGQPQDPHQEPGTHDRSFLEGLPRPSRVAGRKPLCIIRKPVRPIEGCSNIAS